MFERRGDEEQARGVEGRVVVEQGERSRKRRTDVKLVVVAAQAVGDSLLRGRLVAHDPVGLAVLRDRLALGRARNALGEVCACRLRAEVEGAAL